MQHCVLLGSKNIDTGKAHPGYDLTFIQINYCFAREEWLCGNSVDVFCQHQPLQIPSGPFCWYECSHAQLALDFEGQVLWVLSQLDQDGRTAHREASHLRLWPQYLLKWYTSHPLIEGHVLPTKRTWVLKQVLVRTRSLVVLVKMFKAFLILWGDFSELSSEVRWPSCHSSCVMISVAHWYLRDSFPKFFRQSHFLTLNYVMLTQF